MTCQRRICSVCRSAGLPWRPAHPRPPACFMHPRLSVPPSIHTLAYINLVFVRAQNRSEVECIDVSLMKLRYRASSLTLFSPFFSSRSCPHFKMSPGSLPAFPFSWQNKSVKDFRKDTGSGSVKGACLAWRERSRSGHTPRHLHSLHTPSSGCVCEDELVLLALWGHKSVQHIVGTRLPSGDKTQVILMQIIRGVKEIFLK